MVRIGSETDIGLQLEAHESLKKEALVYELLRSCQIHLNLLFKNQPFFSISAKCGTTKGNTSFYCILRHFGNC